MNARLTLTSAVAVILASVSLYPLIQTASWFWAGVGAVIAVAIAGTITRLPSLQAAAGTSVLALIAVTPLLASPSWALKACGVVIVAITAASRPRFRVLQVLACPIAYLSALLIYLNAVFAARLSMAGILPTQASVSYLSTLVSHGMAERYFEPPVPGYPGIILVAAGGIGLMGAATDLIAVRLRSPAIAGLPLLALYCVRITTSAKQGGTGATVVFCLGMIGYLALLAADGRERLRIWGRLVTVWHTSATEPVDAEAPDTRALAASGRRIGLAAACLALIVPLLVPGINVHDLLRAQSGGGNGTGGTQISTPDPLVQMRQQLLSTAPHTVLTYTTTVAHPQYQYLQVYVLNYDSPSQTWKLVLPQPQASDSLDNGTLRTDPGVTPGTSVTRPTTKITLAQGSTGYEAKLGFLPLPYAPTQVQVQESGWQEDEATQMVYSTQPQMSGLQYTVTSTEVNPTQKEEDLAPSYPPGISGSYLSFPSGPHGELTKLAEQITKGARTPYQKAVKLQSYFQSGSFSYDLNVSLPNGINGLVDFLYNVRAGYCQQFAFAMAALARLVGIPSRIAVGYTAGTDAGQGVWKVSTTDAHAWPELYFRGMGWLRFEPTPGGAAGQGTATVPQYGSGAPPGYGKEPGTTPGLTAGGGAEKGVPDLAHLRRPGISGGTAVPSTARGDSIIPWILLIVAIILGLGLVAPAVARRVVRRRRLRMADDAELAHAAWRELRDDLADYGLACRASESPRAVAGRIATTLRLDPSTAEALGRIASAEERARYATAPLPSATLAVDCAAIRRALAREADWTGRWRARLVPTSMVSPIRTALQHVLDVFGWMDAAGLRFRGRSFGAAQHQE
jgi:transglutaminase-like putative cysteine protease